MTEQTNRDMSIVFLLQIERLSFPPFFRVEVHMVESFSSTIEISLELCFRFHTEQSD